MVRVLAPPVTIDGPPATPPPHGLRTAARQITEGSDRWEAGMEFAPETCLNVLSWDPACNSVTGASPGNFQDAAAPPDLVTVRPYQLYVPIQCEAQGYISRDDQGRATRALEAGTSKGMERAFWSDFEGTGNFSLVQTEYVLNANGMTDPIALPPDKAIALMSQALGECALGSRGMIHTPPYVGELWAGLGHLEKDGARLVTKGRGDIVVIGSGYPGTGPTGNPDATPTPTAVWIYGTGMVEYRLGDIELVTDQIAQVLDRKQNTVTWLAQRMVAVSTEACCTFALLVSLT